MSCRYISQTILRYYLPVAIHTPLSRSFPLQVISLFDVPCPSYIIEMLLRVHVVCVDECLVTNPPLVLRFVVVGTAVEQACLLRLEEAAERLAAESVIGPADDWRREIQS